MLVESDLRDLFTRLETNAPSADDVLASLTIRLNEVPTDNRRRTARTVWGAVAAAAAVLIVGVALTAVFSEPSRTRPGPVGTPPSRPTTLTRAELRPSWHFAVSTVPGYHVVRDTFIRVGPLTWVQESAAVTAVHGRVSGRIVVQEHSPGGWTAQLDQQLRTGGRRTHIDGRPAYFTPGRPVVAAVADPWQAAAADADQQPELIWQLPGGAWGMVEGTFGFRPDGRTWNQETALGVMTRLASAVRYGHSSSIAVPFRVGRNPARLFPATVREFPESRAYCVGYSTGDSRTATVDAKGAYLLLCRGPAVDGQHKPTGRYGALISGAVDHGFRSLPDGSQLNAIWPTGSSKLTRDVVFDLLMGTDVTPVLINTETWLTVR